VFIERLLEFLRQRTGSLPVYARLPPLSSKVGKRHTDMEAQRNAEDILHFLFKFLVPLCLVPQIFSVSSVLKILNLD